MSMMLLMALHEQTCSLMPGGILGLPRTREQEKKVKTGATLFPVVSDDLESSIQRCQYSVERMINLKLGCRSIFVFARGQWWQACV